MKITVNHILDAYQGIIDGSVSRDEISTWAAGCMFAAEAGKLDFDPRQDEKTIWNSIQFLSGVDLFQYDHENNPIGYLDDNAGLEEKILEIQKVIDMR
ncbi:MAG: hypothetical protein V4543_05500 [Bacteroidota bacterium]